MESLLGVQCGSWRRKVKPSWTDGIPDNLAAAAADASEWLVLIERCVQSGAWHFNKPDSMIRLQACIAQLDRHLSEPQPDTSKEQP